MSVFSCKRVLGFIKCASKERNLLFSQPSKNRRKEWGDLKANK